MQYEVLIESLVYSGAGLTRLPDGKVAFVPGGLPGDRALVDVHTDKGSYARAALVNLVEAGPGRIQPRCEYAGRCGGCPWQSLDYPLQLEWKHRFVVDALTRVGHLEQAESLVADIVASAKQWHYRNKVEFSLFAEEGVSAAGSGAAIATGAVFAKDTGSRAGAAGNSTAGAPLGDESPATSSPTGARRTGRLNLGLHALGSDQPLSIGRCLLLPKGLADLPKKLSGTLNYLLGKDAVWPYRLSVRHSARSGCTELALWSRPSGMQRAFVAKRLGEVQATDSLVRVLTRGEDAERKVTKVEVLAGRGHWLEELAGQRFMVSAPSFFQVNTPAAEAMVYKVLELADPAGKQAWDLYSGVGSFTLPLAEAGAEVTAVELAGSSIRDLRRNLQVAGLADAVAVVPGDVGRVIGELPAARLAVIDPPRSGLRPEVITGLAESPLQELVYVSCDPQTLARDTARLIAAGFRLQAAYPFDLFPQSYHVETVASFKR